MSLVSFPRSDAPASWVAPPPAEWLTQPLPLQAEPFLVGGAEVTQELKFGQNATLTTENTLSADADVFQGILSVSAGGSLQLVSRVSSTFGQSQTFVIHYSGVEGSAFNLQPLLSQVTTTSRGSPATARVSAHGSSPGS